MASLNMIFIHVQLILGPNDFYSILTEFPKSGGPKVLTIKILKRTDSIFGTLQYCGFINFSWIINLMEMTKSVYIYV